MKAGDVRNLTAAELELKERNLREELQKVRFQKFTGTLSNTASIRKLKKDLARVMTEVASRANTTKTEE